MYYDLKNIVDFDISLLVELLPKKLINKLHIYIVIYAIPFLVMKPGLAPWGDVLVERGILSWIQ